MPSAAQYITDPNSKDAQPVERAYVKEMAARTTALGEAWRYYEGDMARPLRADKTRVDDNVIINLVELLVEKGVSNLFGTDEIGEIEGVEFHLVTAPHPLPLAPLVSLPRLAGEGGRTPPSLFGGGRPGGGEALLAKARRVLGIDSLRAPQRWLDSFWKANKKNLLLHDLGLSGGLSGHVFLKLMPGKPYPRLINLNPSTVTAFWDENDLDRVLWYRIQYPAAGGVRRQDIVRVDPTSQTLSLTLPRIAGEGIEPGAVPSLVKTGEGVRRTGGGESWLIYDYSGSGKGKEWSLDAVTEWPYPWPPVIDWKNLPRPNTYYGKNDIGQNGRLNDSLNFIAGNIQRILKNHANPKSIGTGFSADKLSEAAVGSLWVIDNPDARIYNLEMQSDLASSLAFAQLIRRAFFDSGRELDPATVQDSLGNLTNFGLRVLYKDVLGKNTTKRLHYGDGLRRVCEYALELGGFGAGADVNVVWPDPLPSDPLPTAQALQLDVNVGGLSKTTYLRRRGYDPEQEAALRAQDSASGDPQGDS